jgi:hypothetical protein
MCIFLTPFGFAQGAKSRSLSEAEVVKGLNIYRSAAALTNATKSGCGLTTELFSSG